MRKFFSGNRNFIVPLITVTLLYIILLLVHLAPYEYNISRCISIGQEIKEHHFRLGDNIIVFENEGGYDGQYYYLVALDPFLLDDDAYTYPYRRKRIVYPALAYLLAMGNKDLLPVMLLAVNFLGVCVGMIYVMRLLRMDNISPWYSLMFSINCGMIFGVLYNLTSPLLAAFSLGALYYLRKERYGIAAALLSLALLTRESAIIVILGLFMYELLNRRVKNGMVLLASMVPFILYLLFLQSIAQSDAAAVKTYTRLVTLPLWGVIRAFTVIFRLEDPLEILRKLSVLPLLIFIVSAVIVSLKKNLLSMNRGEILTLLFGGFLLSLFYVIWIHPGSVMRNATLIFPFVLLALSGNRKRYLPYFLAGSLFLTAMMIARFLLYNFWFVYDYHVT